MSAAMTYRETLDAIDAAADLHRTVKAVFKAVCAVAIGPRSRAGRVVAYSVLGHLSACSERTVARAVELLERLGLIRRLGGTPDARAGYGYGYAIDPAAVAALTPRAGFLERCRQRRAERHAARLRARCVAPYPSDKLSDTESGQQEQNNTNNSARASVAPDPFAVDPLSVDPFAVDPLSETPPPPRGAILAAMHDAAAVARAAVAAAFKRGPSPSPSTPSPQPSPQPPRKPQASPPSPPSPPSPTSSTSSSTSSTELDPIRAAHAGSPERLEELDQLAALYGAQNLVRAWSHALEHAKYQPPRPAYLRAWLANPENTAAKPAAKPAAVKGTVYSGAHSPFPSRVDPEPESDEDRRRALDRFDAILEELK